MAIVPHLADAQEIVQETAVALWKQIDKYNPERPFTPWACRFAANKTKEHLRSQGRWNSFLDEEVAAELLVRREEISPQLDQRITPLRECVDSLSGKNRQIVSRYYFDQLPIEQISDDLGRTVDAVYKSLQRLRTALMNCVNRKLAAREAGS